MTEEAKEELKPCAHCGDKNPVMGVVCVHCVNENCRADGPIRFGTDADRAAAWNRRA